jgi:GT2 family glycosyltransferase|tara:strand:+ start:894 stop:1784 length:891 start_codon:yes stop_codon:yes gene_type:complete
MKNLTVVIVTYKTPEKIILDCLKSINTKLKVLIVENSENFKHKNQVSSQFNNVEILCTGKNLGYGSGNNYGIKAAKTDYVLILNPDVTCSEDFFYNIENIISKTQDFSIIGCQYLYDNVFMPAGFFDKKKNNEFVKKFKDNNIESLSAVEWVTGCSMLLNLKKFNTSNIFDQNFFLYFEEFDLCKSIIKNGNKIYTSDKLKIHHLGFKSSLGDNEIENLDAINLKNWHFMWSSFYFYRKNYSYVYALKKLLGKFLRSLFKMIFYSIIFKKNLKNKYLFRFLGLLNSIICRPSNFRG